MRPALLTLCLNVSQYPRVQTFIFFVLIFQSVFVQSYNVHHCDLVRQSPVLQCPPPATSSVIFQSCIVQSCNFNYPQSRSSQSHLIALFINTRRFNPVALMSAFNSATELLHSFTCVINSPLHMRHHMFHHVCLPIPTRKKFKFDKCSRP